MRQRPTASTLPPADREPSPASGGGSTPSIDASWLETGQLSVEEQLAIDEAILDEAERGLRPQRTVRTWMSDEFVVVVGSSSHLETEVDVAACRQAGVRVVRRPSGGATVVLGPGCLMWSVITPYPDAMPSVDTLHAEALDPLCCGFGEEGLPVARRGTSDLALGDHKVSGNALRVRKRAVLYHGTLLDRFDIAAAMALLKHPPREPAYREGRAHTSFLTNLNLGRERLEQLVRRAFSASATAAPCEPARVAELLRDRYQSLAWNERL
jgi:lipoate-protein ligase A